MYYLIYELFVYGLNYYGLLLSLSEFLFEEEDELGER